MPRDAKQDNIREVDPTRRVKECHRVQSSVYWPAPVDHRLNQLVDLAKRAGEQLSKADLLGALVSKAPADGETLGELVRAYRRSTAGDIVLGDATGPVIMLEERRPGRRGSPSSA